MNTAGCAQIHLRGRAVATLETIRYEPHHAVINPDGIQWEPSFGGKVIEGLPAIFWSDGSPWTLANQWLFHRVSSQEIVLDTAFADAKKLKAYAKWLEETKTDWLDFPRLRKERCLDRYRGSLMVEIRAGTLSASTGANRMRVAIALYRWLVDGEMISLGRPLWNEREIEINIGNQTGFQRSIKVRTTDLRIRNRRVPEETLEDGVIPVSSEYRTRILNFAKRYASTELVLQLQLGFFSGLRVGTICDLKLETLTRATRDPSVPGLLYLHVGPNARPPVHTKFGVSGRVPIFRPILEALLAYAQSIRRQRRALRAEVGDKNLLFLTPRGTRYAVRERSGSAAINVAMSRLRDAAAAVGERSLENFYFHRTRATFATALASELMEKNPSKAVGLVKRWLLHADEATSLKYIHYIEESPLKEAASNGFGAAFLSILGGVDDDGYEDT